MAIDLSNLPAPQSINIPNFEDLFQENLGIFLTKNPSYSVLTESDPVVKLIEMFTYRELILRFLLNDVSASNLLPLATGGDLDYISAFYNVERLTIQEEDLTTTPTKELIKEGDDDLRTRTLDRIGGWANAGGADHYKYWAKTLSSNVKDAAVYSSVAGLVNIAILSRDNGGVPTQAMLDVITAGVSAPNIKVLTDTVRVGAAVNKQVSIIANISLHSDAPISVYDSLASIFATEFNNNMTLGWDMTISWVIKTLQQSGVYKVDLQAMNASSSTTLIQDIITNSNEYCSYSLNLSYVGRNQ